MVAHLTRVLTHFLYIYLLIATNAYAEKTQYSVGVQNFTDYLPYSTFSKGEYQGFNRDLLDLFATEQGYQFSYQAMPIKRLYRNFLAGRVDFKYPDNSYWSADQKQGHSILYSQQVVKFTDGVMVLPEHKGRGLDALKKLGVVLGFTPRPYLDLIQSGQVEVFENSDQVRLLKLALLGDLDGVYGNIAVSKHELNEHLSGKGQLVFDSDLPHVTSTRHLSTVMHPELIEEFDQFLVKSKEKIEALKKRYDLR